MTENPSGESLLIRRHIKLVLDSPEFAGSHRLSDFLRYVCDAALDGRTEIDQTEIARAILGKGENFDPVEDTYVRKLATKVRQRLEQYYSSDRPQDPVVITLPRRSYLPRFRLDAPAETEAAERDAGSARSARAERRWWVVGVVVGAVLLLLGGFYLGRRSLAGDPAAGRFVLLARKGGILLGRRDAPPESILVGPVVGDHDQVTVRMTFTPQAERDQAGIMIFDDTDNYVTLDRFLRQRTNLHFAAEVRRSYSQGPESFMEDQEGQTGEPVWLSIRRNEDEFRAFTSLDGHRWTAVCQPIRARLQPGRSRLAVFAFSDLDQGRPVPAVFDRLSIGPTVTADEDTPFPTAAAGWNLINQCQAEVAAVSKKDWTEISFSEGMNRCRWNLLRDMPAGDWSMTGVVGSATWARTFAGLMVSGSKDRVYVLRNSTSKGSIVGSTISWPLFQRPDYPGNPPLTIRLRSIGGILRGELGTGIGSLAPLPLKVDLKSLGGHLQAGFASGRGFYQNGMAVESVTLRFLGVEVLSLMKYK